MGDAVAVDEGLGIFVAATMLDLEAELDLRALDPAAAEAACDRIAATGVLDQVRGDARKRAEHAKRALRTGSLDDQRRELLELVANGVVERYS